MPIGLSGSVKGLKANNWADKPSKSLPKWTTNYSSSVEVVHFTAWLAGHSKLQTDRPTRKLNLPCDDARRGRRDKTANTSELSFVSRRPVIVYQTPHLGLKNGLSFLLDIRIWFCDKPFFKPTLILQNRHPRSGQRSSPIGMFLVYFLPEVAGGQGFRLFLGSRHIYHNESTFLIINEKCVILVPWVLG